MWYDRYPTYRSTSQIEFKSSHIASHTSQIRTWIWETITKVSFRQHFGWKKSEMWIWGTKIDILWCDRFPTYRSTSQIGFKSFLIASNTSQIHRSSRKTTETMFFRLSVGEKNPKCGSGGRKSTYCDATDSLPTAQLVKSGLNVLSMLLIYHKYIDEVGKQTRWSFSAAFWAKKNPKYGSGGRKSTYCDKTDYQTTAHQAKLGLNPIALLLIYHKYIHEVGKLSRRFFSRSILGENNRKCGSGGRKSTYCDTTDFQPTAQQVKLSLNPLHMSLIDHKYVHEVGKLSRRFITAAFWSK